LNFETNKQLNNSTAQQFNNSTIMKHLFLIILAALASGTVAYAQKKTFVRDYTYQASEVDSKVTARANATTQMRTTLLREIGEFLHSERISVSGAYSETIEAITAGIVDMKVIDEQWDGYTYYIKAEMTVDPKDLERRIAAVLNDKQKTKELEDARKRTLAAEAEAARLRKELEQTKNEQQRLALQKGYQQSADALSAEEYFTRGENAYVNRLYELAIEYYQKTIEIDPNNAAAYSDMGDAYDELEDYRGAIRCYQKVIEIDPNNAYAYNNMGIAYYYLEDYRGAIRCYQKAIDIDPNDASIYNKMGIAYEGLKDYHEVIRCHQKAIAIDPNDAFAYSAMGDAYNKLGNTQERIKNYRKAAQLGDEDAQKWLRTFGYKW
jgi:superkiller protein 3